MLHGGRGRVGLQLVEPVEERGHVLAVHAHHAAERAVRVAGGDARASQPADVVRVWGGRRDVAELLRGHVRAARGQSGEPAHERGHVLALHRIHAAERARPVGLGPAGRDARVGEPQDVVRVWGGRRDIAERLPVGVGRLPRGRVAHLHERGEPAHERGHVLALHRIHAAERARPVGLGPAGRDARGRGPSDVVGVRGGRRDVAERHGVRVCGRSG